LEPREQLVDRFAAPQREACAVVQRHARGLCKCLRRGVHNEFPGGQVVVWPAVNPEQLGVAADLVERRRVDALRVGEHRFEDVAHLETVRVFLVVKDVAARDRRLIEVPDERLFSQRKVTKALCVELHDGGVVDALEQIFAVGSRAGGCCGCGGGRSARDRK
jgi:hypothetical protein